MFATADCLYLYLESGLHIGTGQAGAAVDLPVQREAATGYPFVPASSLKGALRARAREMRGPLELVAHFGSPASSEEKQEGTLVFSDGRLLLFPVRCLRGLFAWVTTAEVWARHRRDLAAYGADVSGVPQLSPPGAEDAAVVPQSPLVTSKQTVVLEEFSFPANPREEVAALANWAADHAFPKDPEHDYWRHRVRQALVVLSEAAFRHFAEHTTEVIPRVQIDPTTGTAAEGSLWTEEFVPPEALLYAMVGTRPQAPLDSMAWLKGLGLWHLQLGGHRALGKGIVRLGWLGGPAEKQVGHT